MTAAAGGLVVVPFFVLSATVAWRMLSSLLIQVCVQGACGVIRARLTAMSPDAIRGFYPGVTYQLGNLIAALNLPLQETIAKHHGYPTALAWNVVPALALAIAPSPVGNEAEDVRFGSTGTQHPAPARNRRSRHPGSLWGGGENRRKSQPGSSASQIPPQRG
ncbi:hypothetical protein AB0D42_39055 [Streptomyces sp. NPDC048304]|uniref:hypothetical protein n=1 Tax=Streptomyces sp. NPDC048304 TaxID=3154820 RepID=UPI00340177B4